MNIIVEFTIVFYAMVHLTMVLDPGIPWYCTRVYRGFVTNALFHTGKVIH